MLAANRERDFAALKMHLHNGFQEAKRQQGQEGEAAASAGPDVKAEALAEQRSAT